MYMYDKYPSILTISVPLLYATPGFLLYILWCLREYWAEEALLFLPICFMTHLHVILDIFYCRKSNEKYSPEFIRTS